MSYLPSDIQHIFQIIHPLDHYLHGFKLLATVDSTNTYLIKQRHVLGHYLVLAEQQTQGRGRFENRWISPVGNIYLSLLWHHPKQLFQLTHLYHAAGQAIVEALKHLGLHRVYLKAPNDIFCDEKKLGGILIELFQNKNACSVIIGVGLNVHLTDNNITHSITQPWIDVNAINPTLAHRANLVGIIVRQLIKTLLQTESKE